MEREMPDPSYEVLYVKPHVAVELKMTETASVDTIIILNRMKESTPEILDAEKKVWRNVAP